MSTDSLPHRCPQCNAIVVDRRSPICTSCRVELPAEWVMTPKQVAKVEAFDRNAKAEHLSAMKELDSIKSSSEIPGP